MNLEGTETARSLMKAFAGESQARNRYTFYAQVARKEGLIQIAQIFQLTAAKMCIRDSRWRTLRRR